MVTDRRDLLYDIAGYIISNRATVRQTAKVFGYSKSTIHNMMTKELYDYSIVLHTGVKNILQYNKSQRSYRGGIATRNKYKLNK